jgi:hypothetical protein
MSKAGKRMIEALREAMATIGVPLRMRGDG